jgi:hypothetical protein
MFMGAFMNKNPHSIGDYERYARFQDHLKSSGLSTPTKDVFTSFGSLSTLERLRPLLAELCPEHTGPLRLAISEKRVAKTAKAGSKAKGGKRGVARIVSVEKADLPHSIKVTLSRLRQEYDQHDEDFIDFDDDGESDDLKPLPVSTIRDSETTLCQIAQSCKNRNKDIVFTKKSIKYWIDDALSRRCSCRGLACQIGKLKSFMLHHQEGQKTTLYKHLKKLHKRFGRLGEKQAKKKDIKLAQNPLNLETAWWKAEELFNNALSAPLGYRYRYKLFLEAVAIALPIVAPLRIGDHSLLRIGVQLIRHDDGWELTTETEKTGLHYHRTRLWPEITKFLDAVILEDAPGGDLMAGYQSRIGSSIFSHDGGKTGYNRNWISDIWSKHFSHGAHIVRTLWHDGLYTDEEKDDKTHVALALCGQVSERTSLAYRLKHRNKRFLVEGRNMLSNAMFAVLKHE